MRKIVVIPMDSIEALIKSGCSYQYLYEYFNPAGYFDEIYCLSPIGYGITTINEIIKIENVYYVQASEEQFYKIIEKISPDVVRAYGGRGCCDLAIANKVKNIPIVVSVHDTNTELISHSLIYADYIICVSEAVKKAVKNKLMIDEARLQVIPNRIQTDIFKRRSDTKYELWLEEKYGKGRHILHVGRKAAQKNLDTLIKSIRYLPEEYKVIFLGNGNIKEYKELAINEEVEERCFFEPAVCKEELINFYNWCDCMCTPSRYEGFGFVFIEAAACECMIVTSNIGPMNEYLCNEKSAYLVDQYENEKELAQIIQVACEVTEKNKEIRKEARKVGLKFSKIVIDQMDVLFYEKVAGEKYDNKCLSNLIEKIENRQVIIFGVGKRGLRLKTFIERKEIAYWVDTDQKKIDKLIDGIKVISYEQLKKIHLKYLVVISPEKRTEIEKMLIRDKISCCNMEVYLILKNRLKLGVM